VDVAIGRRETHVEIAYGEDSIGHASAVLGIERVAQAIANEN